MIESSVQDATSVIQAQNHFAVIVAGDKLVIEMEHYGKNNVIKAYPLRYIPNCFAETHSWTK